MATANLQTGAEEEAEDDDDKNKEPFLVDTFWEDYKNYDVPKFALVGAQLDEQERQDMEHQEKQRAHRLRIKETKVKSKLL